MSDKRKVTARVNPSKRTVTLFEQVDGVANEVGTYRSVSGTNVEFGAGLIRMDLEETWDYHPITRQPIGSRRAFFNRSKVSRYVDKETNRPVTDARGVMIDGSSVYYYGDK